MTTRMKLSKERTEIQQIRYHSTKGLSRRLSVVKRMKLIAE